jgi:hypothetical protein
MAYVMMTVTQREQVVIVRVYYARLHTRNGQRFLRHALTSALQDVQPKSLDYVMKILSEKDMKDRV